MRIDHLLRVPLPGSKKSYLSGNIYPDIRIPIRKITQTNGCVFPIYDTSGAYTDPVIPIDITSGLLTIRTSWLESRDDTEIYQKILIQRFEN